jgi:hypothetical protein
VENLHRPDREHPPDWRKDVFAGAADSATNHNPFWVEQPDDITKGDRDREPKLLPNLERDGIAAIGRELEREGRTFFPRF